MNEIHHGSICLRLAGIITGMALANLAWSQQVNPQTLITPPALCIAEQAIYDDNLFHLNRAADITQRLGPDASRDDTLLQTSACGNGDWLLGQQEFVLNLLVADNRYQNNRALNNTSGNGKLLWNWNVMGDWYGKIGGDYVRTLGSFLNDRPLVKDMVDSYQYFGELNHDIGSIVSVTIGGIQRDIAHNAESRQVDNFRSTAAYAGLTLTSRADNYIGVNFQRTKAAYPFDLIINDVAFDRDYQESNGSVRLHYALGKQTILHGSIGYLKREYLHADEANYTGDTWHAGLQWSPTTITQVEFTGWKELNAYFDSEADHFVSRGASITPTWMPNEKLKVAAVLWWERQQYLARSLTVLESAPREDKVRAAAIDLIYGPVKWLDIDLSYRYEQHDSSQLLYGFNDHVVSLRVRGKL